ncbi:MAG: FtsW/RodA/SpoVE family cell cycle protein [Candidatus Puniceispirillales bacterium]
MFNRTDRSFVSIWWWTIDRTILSLALLLCVAGLFMVMAASPTIALKIGYNEWHFVIRHAVFLVLCLILMVSMAMLNEGMIRVVGILGLIATMIMIGMTLMIGDEVKGATRWISLGAFKIQPSEFAKPCFAITCAWLLSMWREEQNFPGWIISIGLLGLMVLLLVLQPDIGMTILFVMTWAMLIFLAGMPIGQVIGLAALVPIAGYLAYIFMPHVTIRVNKFLNGTNDQAEIAMESFSHGGLLGVGASEGVIKKYLPDAHADFIFAVTAEEYGVLICIALIICYIIVVQRGFAHAQTSNSLFRTLAIAGLTLQFGLQAAIHMASSVQLIPTKGMTLPFISYGGSSLMTSGLTIGLLIALTRHRQYRDAPPQTETTTQTKHGEAYG